MSLTLPQNTADILEIYGFAGRGADACDSLSWRTDEDRIRFLADCSDTFAWASADCEPIEEGDEVLLRQCLEDLRPFGETYLISELFAARKRNMRPMRLWLGTHPGREPVRPMGFVTTFPPCWSRTRPQVRRLVLQFL